MKRKLIAAMLAGTMILCLLPTPLSSIALAEGETLISNRAGLEAIKDDPYGSYRLTADINLAGSDWTPLPAFSGKLDGGDHIIKNLSITDTTENGRGLFASIASTGEVCNLGMEDVNITAGDRAGGIAGTNGGTIRRCYVTGAVNGKQYAGGIVGDNQGAIEICYSRVSVSGANDLGGLAGSNSGMIEECYTASTVADSVMNNYLEFNATPASQLNPSGYISIPNIDAYKATDFTLEAWFNWDNAGTDDINFIIGKGFEQFEIHTGGGSGYNGLRFIPVPTDAAGSYHGDSWIDVHDALQTGWFHVAAVYSYNSSLTNQNVKIQIYINGEPQDLWQKPSSAGSAVSVGKIATLSRSANPLASNSHPISIGKRTGDGYYFGGKIADVRFWNTVRTGEQIKVNKDKVLSGTEAGLVGYWKLNDSLSGTLDGETVADSTNNNNSGTIHGDVTQTKLGTATNKGALAGSISDTGIVSSCYYDATLYGSDPSVEGTAKSTADMKLPSTYIGWDFDATWKIGDNDYPNLGFKTVNSVSVTPTVANVATGGKQSFLANVIGANSPASTVTWSVEGNTSTATLISSGGVLSVGSDETATSLTVRATSTADTAKSVAAAVAVTAATHGITVSLPSLDFGTVNEGYAQPDAQTVTVTYTGNIGSIMLAQPTSVDYEIGTLSATTLSAGSKTATFTVRPKANLLAGTHDLPIEIVTIPAQASEITVTPRFSVVNIHNLQVSPGATFMQGNAPDTTIKVGAGVLGFSLNNFGSVQMGPQGGTLESLMDGTDYDKAAGSIIIKLRRNYLNTLIPGVYSLRINLTNLPWQGSPSYVETTITVNASDNGGDVGADVPKTGDSATPALWIGLMLLAGTGLAVSAVRRRKRQNG